MIVGGLGVLRPGKTAIRRSPDQRPEAYHRHHPHSPGLPRNRRVLDSLALLTVIVGLVWTIGSASPKPPPDSPIPSPPSLGVRSIAVGLTAFLWPQPPTLMATVIGIIQLTQAQPARRTHSP